MFEFVPMTDRIKSIRAKRDAFTGGKNMSINTERTKIYTDYYKAHENEYPMLKRAGALYTWCATREIRVYDDDIFVGTPGPDQRSVSPYVEWDCSWIPAVVNDDDAFREAWQSGKGVYMSDEQREILRDAYDYWKDRSLSKMVQGALTDDFYASDGTGGILTLTSSSDPLRAGCSGLPQGHYIANFNKVINVGFGEVRRQVLEKLEQMRGKVFGNDAKKHVFYYALLRVCDGAILLSKRYAAACREKAETAVEPRRSELLQMAESLDWIMENPCRTYWEGLQATIFYQLMLSTDAQQHGQSQGRVDQYVGALLDADLASGRVSNEQAQEYSDAFILRLSDIIVLPGFADNKRIIALHNSGQNLYSSIYNGLTPTAGIALTLGGMKPDGSDASNEATRKFLQTYGRMGLPDPTVALRICDSTPDDVWRLGIESSKRCGGIPQLQNDNLIIPMLVEKLGFTLEDARDYSIVGCVEPAGSGNEWPACGMTGRESIWNMVNLIPITVNGGYNKMTGKTGLVCKKLYECESFEEFRSNFEAQMQYALDWTVSYANTFEMVYSHYFPCIVASSMMEGCLEKGKDVTEGGSKYNRCGLTAIGTSNVGDSLMSIKKLCFDDKTVSTREMYDALNANWEGYEDLRQTILNEVPHYGNDIDEADELASWGIGKFAEIMSKEVGPRGNYSGGTFTMTAHIRHGATTPATPDGRKDGEPLADAISPRQGLDKNGPTAYICSAAKLPQFELTNGDQLNIRFSPKSVEGDMGALKLRQLIVTYFRLGGMQVQFNVVSTDQLHEAQENPDEFKDLVVRIAGFSTYFVSMDKKSQDDFILRTEQAM